MSKQKFSSIELIIIVSTIVASITGIGSVIFSYYQLKASVDIFNENQEQIEIQKLYSELVKLDSLKAELNQTRTIAEARPECNYHTSVVDIFPSDSMKGRIFLGDIGNRSINTKIIEILIDMENIRGIKSQIEKYNFPLCPQVDMSFNILRENLIEADKLVDDRIALLEYELRRKQN